MNFLPKSKAYFQEALRYIPGGVNSPVRAFKAVGGTPPFICSAKGSHIYDEDGNVYIDMVNSWGSMILGHAHPIVSSAMKAAAMNSISFGAPTLKETQLAKKIVSMVPSIEKVRMVNSGTEATMSAIRLARGYTGKNKIIKLEGCYHGHCDSFLISAGSGSTTMGIPDSLGVTKRTAQDTLVVPFNDSKAIEHLIEGKYDEIAAVILEPIAGNMGCIAFEKNSLIEIRNLCDRYNIVLIFDEVITGFRIGKGGAQEYYQIFPDITTLGKIVGGGMPVGAYGGKKEIMDWITPLGPVYQAGTLSGNPIAMSIGHSMLSHLEKHPETYIELERKTKQLEEGFKHNLSLLNLNYTVNRVGSMISLFFTKSPVNSLFQAKKSNLEIFKKYFHSMLKRGIYLPPSQFESLFISLAITEEDILRIVQSNYEALKEIH